MAFLLFFVIVNETATLWTYLVLSASKASIPYNRFGGWRGNVEADLQHRFSDLWSPSVSPRHPSSPLANQRRLPTYKEPAPPATHPTATAIFAARVTLFRPPT